MSSDPVIDEIRAVRHKISQECDHDPAKLVAYFMRFQEQYRDRLLKEGQASDAAERHERVVERHEEAPAQ